MNDFKFGDIVMHGTLGKGVFLGGSDKLTDSPDLVEYAEVIFSNKVVAHTILLDDLTPFNKDFMETSFTDSAGEKYTFKCDLGDDLFITGRGGKKVTNIMVRDIPKFIECLSKFLDFHYDN